jgi:hypothetical protein
MVCICIVQQPQIINYKQWIDFKIYNFHSYEFQPNLNVFFKICTSIELFLPIIIPIPRPNKPCVKSLRIASHCVHLRFFFFKICLIQHDRHICYAKSSMMNNLCPLCSTLFLCTIPPYVVGSYHFKSTNSKKFPLISFSCLTIYPSESC